MNRRCLSFIVAGLIAVIVASSIVIYEGSIFKSSVPVAWQRPIENLATTTGLAADDGKVFTVDESGNLDCYDSYSGESLWNSSTNSNFDSTPIISGGKLYVGSELASVSCLDETSGQFQWSFIGWLGNSYYMKRAPDSIIVEDGSVFAVTEDGGVSVHNATTGESLWQAVPLYETGTYGDISDLNNTWSVSGHPLGGDPFEGNSVYALGGNWSSQYIFKLNTDNGAILWQSNIKINVLIGIPNVIGSYQGQVIMQNGNQTFSLNQTSGEPLWSYNITALTYQPTIYNNLLLFGASDGNFYAVNLTNGTLAWKTKVDSQNLFSQVIPNNPIVSSPVIIDSQNQMLFWSFGFGVDSQRQFNETVCGLDLASGNVVWTRQIQDNTPIYGQTISLVQNEGTVFVTEKNTLWSLNASTGKLIQKEHFVYYVLPPIILGNETFVAADYKLIAYA